LNESFLYFIWQYKLFEFQTLKTKQGEPVEILYCGIRNDQSGPDFTNCKLKIGDTIWVGNIEIDTKSSDWYKHKHHTNKSYNSIIAHVVYECDTNIKNEIPVIELSNYIDEKRLDLYNTLMLREATIPCENFVKNVEGFVKGNAIERKSHERLRDKTFVLFNLLNECNNNWENVFYLTLFRNFGTNVNALPMELLARNIPLQIFAKHKQNSTQIHALLFGVAGFLEQDIDDLYYNSLKQEFQFLKIKYNLQCLDESVWKMGKIRLGNYPKQRLAALSGIIIQSSHLFSKILASNSIEDIKNLFNIEIDDYWRNKYDFSKTCNRLTYISKDFINTIIANTIVPCMFAYAQFINDLDLEEKCLKIYSETTPEKNSITKLFEGFEFEHKNVLQSQGILQLYRNYCTKKRCLECEIGLNIFKSDI
jgi:hypothetical protein